MRDQPTKRCAIYTRKSTEEGLDQAFNSLDAQYEACAAYVMSQQHEGWTVCDGRYDDGGFSGGNLDRPGLVQLLADVKAGLVDVIIVYKIDRLTRSLTDFAKIVDVLDGAGASFVSITQSFNTTTSMGRLTLNVLLSFAQFEREVIAERVRDKVAASKAKGIWMGGTLPIGYDVINRELIVNQEEAATVRYIFQRYLELGNLIALQADLARRETTTKIRLRRDGSVHGGKAWWTGTLYYLLKNQLYIGKIVHRGTYHEGLQLPIVDQDLFEQVQAKLASNSMSHRKREYAAHNSLLTGMIRDGLDRPMTPRQAHKGPKRYCYYGSNCSKDVSDQLAELIWRIPAPEIERAVIEQVAAVIENGEAWGDRDAMTATDSINLVSARAKLAAKLRDDQRRDQRDLLQEIGLKIRVFEDRIESSVSAHALAKKVGMVADKHPTDDRIAFELAPLIRRRGQELRIIFPPQNVGQASPDRKLIEMVVDAYRARDQLINRTSNADDAELRRKARFTWLAPDIVVAIMEGRQPVNLTARLLRRTGTLPLSWKQQRISLGF